MQALIQALLVKAQAQSWNVPLYEIQRIPGAVVDGDDTLLKVCQFAQLAATAFSPAVPWSADFMLPKLMRFLVRVLGLDFIAVDLFDHELGFGSQLLGLSVAFFMVICCNAAR